MPVPYGVEKNTFTERRARILAVPSGTINTNQFSFLTTLSTHNPHLPKQVGVVLTKYTQNHLINSQKFKIWMKSEALLPTLYEDTARRQGKAIRQRLNSGNGNCNFLAVNIPFLTFAIAFCDRVGKDNC